MNMLKILLTIVLGFGIISQSSFYSHIVLGCAGWILPVTIATILSFVTYQFAIKKSFKAPSSPLPLWPSLCLLGLIFIFVSLEAAHYPLGGWDAWSCWNLKAKFIFLSQDQWKNMLDPILWRSNTHYPLGLPLINVFFWDLLGSDPAWVPACVALVFTVLGAGILLFTLQRLTGRLIEPLILTALVFLLPFNITLSASQYSDILVGLYLLCALVCFLSNELIFCAIFLGLLSFTKTEGTLAALLLGVLVFTKHRKDILPFCLTFAIAALPTIIFQLFFAPKNEAFVNGLLSTVKPSDLSRLWIIVSGTVVELLSLKWNGIWVLLIITIGLNWKKASGKNLNTIGIFLVAYVALVMGYYYVNTFFEINWWMSNTLNRILFSLAPSAMLWLGLCLL